MTCGILWRASGWLCLYAKRLGTSYGSRCVKPPIVIGDVSRPARLPWSGQNMRNP